jgi:hypothetical protein
MRQATLCKNNNALFEFELGVRVNKLQILRKDDSVEVEPNVWLDKKNWTEINMILLKHGFKWLSLGRDSRWIKR